MYLWFFPLTGEIGPMKSTVTLLDGIFPSGGQKTKFLATAFRHTSPDRQKLMMSLCSAGFRCIEAPGH